ncbi:MAG: DUF4159 domain-containing protein [Elusimicrobia bacterium]|nr:DUF4159 domain-containing protein [Elusimicrobiota bacterium]
MSFTHPALLWALPLALVPPILHLLSLRRARRELFSDLTLLRAVEAKARPRRRLRSWLLAAARALLAAALILAWAGPVVSTDPGAADGEAGTALVILLDASYSMGYRVHGKTRFETARSAAERVVRGLDPADRVAAVVFSDRWEAPTSTPKWAAGSSEALEILSKASLSHRGTDICAALKAAHGLLAQAEARRRTRRAVLVLSDGARHGLSCEVPEPEPGVKVLGLSWADAPSNGWVTRGGPAAQSSAASPILEVRGQGTGPAAGPTTARLFLSGVRAGASGTAVLDLGRKHEAAAVLRLGPAIDPSRPSWKGWVDLTPDALSGDDRWYFSFRHSRRPRALVLFGSQDFFRAGRGGYFLKELLGAEKGSLLGWDADFLELSRLAEALLTDYRVVVLSDFRDVPAGARAGLEDFVRSGGGLWVLPGGATTDEAFAALSRLLPAGVGPVVSSPEPFGLSAPGGFEEFDLDKVAVRRYRRLEPKPGARVVFRDSRGAPVLVAGPLGGGEVVLWASPLDLEATNLGLKPAFVSWAQRSLDEAQGQPELKTEVFQAFVDAPLSMTWKEGEPLPSSVKVRSPDGRLSQLYPKGRSVSFSDTSVPGLYTVAEEGRSARERVYAVNTDRGRESDPRRADSPPWSPVRSDAFEEDLRGALFGREARGSFMSAAALLLLVEMLLAFPWRQRTAALAPSGEWKTARASGDGGPEPPADRAKGRVPAAAALLLVLLLEVQALAQPPPASGSPTASGERPSPSGTAAYGDLFVWSQLKLGPDWDPYPEVHREALELFGRVTSVLVWPERRVLSPEDELLFESPLLLLAGASAPPALTEQQLRNLRSFVSGGGMLWIEDVSGAAASSFDRWVRKAFLSALLPEAELAPLSSDHVLYKTFFFLRGPAGRANVRPSLEGLAWGGRIAVLYSRNDILGAWAKDGLGRPLFACAPGGEAQRHNSRKLTLNILMYSLTGSYKADAVHQPYLLEKMRMGIP